MEQDSLLGLLREMRRHVDRVCWALVFAAVALPALVGAVATVVMIGVGR